MTQLKPTGDCIRTDSDTGAGEDRPSPPETPAVNNDAALNTAGRIDGLVKQLEGLRPIAEEYDRQRQINGLPPSSHTVITLLRNEIRQSSDHIHSSIKLIQQDQELAATDEAAAGGKQR